MANVPRELRDILPRLASELGVDIITKEGKRETIGQPVLSLLENCIALAYHAESLSVEDYQCGLKYAEALLDICWEMINTGHWKDVDITWRYLYSYASLFKVVYMLLDGKASHKDVIQACDMGLLLGSPILSNILNRTASALCSSHKSVKMNATKDKSTEPQPKMRKVSPHNILTIDPKHAVSRINCPSLETFKRDYMDKKLPVILEGCIDYWPALSVRKWSTDYLVEVAGCRNVPIEIGSRYTDETWSQKVMSVGEFVEHYVLCQDAGEEKGYLAQHQLFDQIPELRSDFSVPTYCCLSDTDETVVINMWFGPEGTVSPLHHDPKNNLLAQVMGEKYLRLYPENATPLLYPHDSHLLLNTSQVDVENPDLEKFPLFATAPYWECMLNTGDMLFIPPRCWHFVRSLSVSCSLSFWWE